MSKKDQATNLIKKAKQAWDNTKEARDAIEAAKKPVDIATKSFDQAIAQFEEGDLLAADEDLRKVQVCVEALYDCCVAIYNRFGVGLELRRREERIVSAQIYYGANYLYGPSCSAAAERMRSDLNRVRQFKDLADPLATVAGILLGVQFLDVKDLAGKLTSLTALDGMAVKGIYDRTREMKKTVDLLVPVVENVIRQLDRQAKAFEKFIELTQKTKTVAR